MRQPWSFLVKGDEGPFVSNCQKRITELLEMSLPIVKFGYFPELHLGIVLAFHKHNLGRNEHKIEK